ESRAAEGVQERSSDRPLGRKFRCCRRLFAGKRSESFCPAWPPSAQRPHPADDGPPDLVRRIFLEKMEPRDRHLGLRWQPAGEVEIRAAGDEQTGLGLHEQLGYTARPQPIRVSGRDPSHVRRLPPRWGFPGPSRRRPWPGSANGRRYSAISSAERVRRMAPGRIVSTKKLSCRTIASPPSERSAFKAGRIFNLSQWSQPCGRTIASMYAIPLTASR